MAQARVALVANEPEDVVYTEVVPTKQKKVA
jgi:hypothetical protein